MEGTLTPTGSAAELVIMLTGAKLPTLPADAPIAWRLSAYAPVPVSISRLLN
jgi:hypothetical protein